jgi:transmembrane sensor
MIHHDLRQDPIEADAAAWLARQDAGPLDPEQQQAFDTWINTSTLHRVAFLRLETAWRQADQLRFQLPQPMVNREQAAPSVWRRWVPMAAAAAIVLAVLVPPPGRWDWPLARGQAFSTGIGDRYSVSLQDGSKVELNTDTRLHASVDDTSREVRLDKGEAYFEVVHDEKRPFVVVSGDLRIVDVGTKFLVRRDKGKLEVIVTEGAVLVENMADPTGMPPVLVHQMNGIVARDAKIEMTGRSEGQVMDALGWRRGMLIFAERPLREVVAEFNRYNRKQLVVPDDGPLGDIRIGGSFEATNVDAFARLLRTGFGLSVVDDGKRIKISNKQ